MAKDQIDWVRCIIDPRGSGNIDNPLSNFLTHPADKPVGSFHNMNLTVNPNSQYKPKQPKPRRPPNQSFLVRQAQPDFQPDDDQEVYLGFKPGYSLEVTPPALLFRYRVNAKDLPSTFDQNFIRNDEVNFRLSIPGRSLSLNEASVVPYWDSDKNKENFPKSQLPKIITRTPKFAQMQSSIFKVTIKVDNSVRRITQEHVANGLVFEKAHIKRTTDLLRAMVANDQYIFDVYLQETKSTNPKGLVKELVNGFEAERKGGIIFRHFYTQNLALSNAMHNLESSLKPPEDRPNLKVSPATSYTDLFEFTTRQGVAVVQSMEDTANKVQELNSNLVTIRVLELPGAGDIKYMAFLNTVGADLRLNPGDKLHINFRLKNRVKHEEWSMHIATPPTFAVQGDTFGILYRPRAPRSKTSDVNSNTGRSNAKDADNADTSENTDDGCPYQTTILPVSSMKEASTLDQARMILAKTPAIRCFVTINPSDRAEARLIKSLNLLAHGCRGVLNIQGVSKREKFPSSQAFGKILLMHDSIPEDRHSCVNEKGRQYLEQRLTDPDHKKVIEHISNLPVKQGKGIGMIIGYPGSGKTRTTAEIVAAILISNPSAVIVVAGPSNLSVDICVQKISVTLHQAGLEKFVVRSHTEATEVAYLVGRQNVKFAEGFAKQMEDFAADTAHRLELEFLDSSKLPAKDKLTKEAKEKLARLTALPDTSPWSLHHQTALISVFSSIPEFTECVALIKTFPDELSSTDSNDSKEPQATPYPVDALTAANLEKFLPSMKQGIKEFFYDILDYYGIEPVITDIAKPAFKSEEVKQAPNLPTFFSLSSEDKSFESGSDSEEGNIDENGAMVGNKPKSSKPKKKTSKMTKAQKKSLMIEEARNANFDYFNDDLYRVVQLSDEHIKGEGQVLNIVESLLPDGGVDIRHKSIPTEVQTNAFLSNMIDDLNADLVPRFAGVQDKRFKLPELSVGMAGLKIAQRDERKYYTFLTQYGRYEEESKAMGVEIADMKSNAKELLREVKKVANVAGFTINSLGTAYNYRNIPKVDYLIIDEAGKVNLANLVIPLANLNIDNLLLVGDDNQLAPIVPFMTNPGCTQELSQSAVTYFRKNHWEHATLSCQRRGPPGIASIYGKLFYRDVVQDAPCTTAPGAHALTPKYLKFYRDHFPMNSSSLPIRFFEIEGCKEVLDPVTGSYYNLESAAFIMNLIERLAVDGFDLANSPCITHYKAQQKIYRYALANLHREFPDRGFNKVISYTTDSIQGDEAPNPIADPIRTHKTGFTNNRGRNVVLLSRATDFCTVVGSTYQLTLDHSGTPYLRQAFDVARQKGCCVTITKLAHGDWLEHRYVCSSLTF
ncbi:hypothetical protein BP6252_07935 [Coleophoma cylindrospora]|uniref:DNA2/NAM7 helicase-like C-terminal domain-containing protein n=1 Tax=Coleophoma cylindrospora TaxID=1849047 RepID=A0A3D8RBF7_9HELO|nr:hypothetical protein BP6252_07935 [Coleophoma cylindrospora]